MEKLTDKINRIRDAKRLLIEGAFWIIDIIQTYPSDSTNPSKATLKAHMEGDGFIRDFDLEKTDVEVFD